MEQKNIVKKIMLTAKGVSRRLFLSRGVQFSLLAGFSGITSTAYAAKVNNKNLTDVEYNVLNKLRIVMLPTQKYGLPSSTDVAVMANVDEWVGKLNQRTRLLLKMGARTIEYGSLYRFSRFSKMADDTAVRHVHNWQTGNVLQRGVISSLKMLITLSYWQDSKTWNGLEYDGPVTEKWGIRRLGNAPVPR
jgi:hypothetical protein